MNLWLYLFSGTTFVIVAILLYALLRIHNGKTKVKDIPILLFSYSVAAILCYHAFWHFKYYILASIIVWFVVILFALTVPPEKEEHPNEEPVPVIAMICVIVLCIVFSFLAIPFVMISMYLDSVPTGIRR